MDWETRDELMERYGYDLTACFEYNPQEGLEIEEIDKILAVWEGQNDEDDWRWIVSLTNGKFAFIKGGCDYTGWDCQSWAWHEIKDTAEECLTEALPSNEPSRGSHNMDAVYASLKEQLEKGKNKTWRDVMDEVIGDVNIIDITPKLPFDDLEE